jgi:hypothetical protein
MFLNIKGEQNVMDKNTGHTFVMECFTVLDLWDVYLLYHDIYDRCQFKNGRANCFKLTSHR